MAHVAYKDIVVKIGTNVIANEEGLLETAVMRSIVSQVAILRKKGCNMILVSSGAIAAGMSTIGLLESMDVAVRRQILAAVGQVKLMQQYEDLFEAVGLICAQVLATKDDFRDRQHYLNMHQCIQGLLDQGIIPIINENDAVSVTTLMFTDNDELAGRITSMMNTDALIILTNVDGVYDRDPSNPQARVLHELDACSLGWQQCLIDQKSHFGRGGMQTKCDIACRLSRLGITTHIANGRTPGLLLDLVAGKQLGTVSRGHEETSSYKRWIAESRGHEKGIVTINAGAQEALQREGAATSLLPVGITKVEGNFEKGDLLSISDEEGQEIGLGMAEYGIERAQEIIGKRGGKELIHYDHLFLYS